MEWSSTHSTDEPLIIGQHFAFVGNMVDVEFAWRDFAYLKCTPNASTPVADAEIKHDIYPEHSPTA